MTNHIDYRKELNKARKTAAGFERDGHNEAIEAYWEVCCGDVLVAERNIATQSREWENASLAKELIGIAEYLEEYDHMLDNLYTAVSRMADAIFERPGLKLRLLELELRILGRIEARSGHEIGLSDDVRREIGFYSRNIDRADKGLFDEIEQRGHLKHDPTEWSAEYESVIDEAEEKIASLLKETPRGMGFCFEYWQTKERILREDYGIEWRNPAVMNPGVIFD